MKRSFISFSRLQRRGPSLHSNPGEILTTRALLSSMDSSPTADELEAADALLQLQQPFIINPEPPPLYAGILPRWGRRRPRTITSPDPSPPPEAKEPIPDPSAVAAASSPSTPMSFPATSEEAEPKPISPKKPWPFPNSKLHKEWLRRENEKIAVLSALKVKFFQDLAALKSSHQRLHARNSWLKNIRFQLEGRERERKRRRVMGNEAGNGSNGWDHARLGGQRPMNGWDATTVGPNVGERVWMLPDLNETAEEVERRERAALARKQRVEMQRKKRTPPLPPRPPTRCKIAR